MAMSLIIQTKINFRCLIELGGGVGTITGIVRSIITQFIQHVLLLTITRLVHRLLKASTCRCSLTLIRAPQRL